MGPPRARARKRRTRPWPGFWESPPAERRGNVDLHGPAHSVPARGRYWTRSPLRGATRARSHRRDLRTPVRESSKPSIGGRRAGAVWRSTAGRNARARRRGGRRARRGRRSCGALRGRGAGRCVQRTSRPAEVAGESRQSSVPSRCPKRLVGRSPLRPGPSPRRGPRRRPRIARRHLFRAVRGGSRTASLSTPRSIPRKTRFGGSAVSAFELARTRRGTR